MGLEYTNGTVANPDTGMWLHHGVMVNINRTDSVCGPRAYGQRFFASGNERTAVDFSAGGTFKAGYFLSADDAIALSVELMNMLDDPQQDVVLTITYEIVEGVHAKNFLGLTPYWLDSGGCGPSGLPAYRDTTFEYSSPPVRGVIDGTFTFAGGHLHDGGTHIELMKNGQVMCNLNATYGAYEYMANSERHISSIDTCQPGKVDPGDVWSLVAHYDTQLHKPMAKSDGSLEPVMGIMLLYAASDTPEVMFTHLNTILTWIIVMAAALLIAAWLGLGGYLNWCGNLRESRTLSNRDMDLKQPLMTIFSMETVPSRVNSGTLLEEPKFLRREPATSLPSTLLLLFPPFDPLHPILLYKPPGTPKTMRRTILFASLFSSISLAAALSPLDFFRSASGSLSSLQSHQYAGQVPMNPGPFQPEEPSTGGSAGNGRPSDSTLSISDILPQTRKINIFASLTRDISSVTGRLESTKPEDNTTLLAPLNSAMQALPRKPWEDRPGDNSGISAQRNEDKAAQNLARFVEEHVVPTSPWKAGEEGKIKTLGGQELWWEEKDGKKVIMPGNLEVDGVVGRVGNGEIWAVQGVVNYA
ncbi:hypothetical protein H2202_009433 [Exophiala xenobiotica]|nr:hypothetical protein H2202_009433 [Exophiala xenobiotica]